MILRLTAPEYEPSVGPRWRAGGQRPRLRASLFAVLATLWAVWPSLWPSVALLSTKLALRRAAEGVVTSSLSLAPEDPRQAMALLAEDPLTRASRALYEAAVVQAGSVAEPFRPVGALSGGGHVRIVQAALEMNTIFGAKADGARAAVERLIFHAAGEAGVDAAYLRRTAARESGLDPFAAASTSSARGLFQFVEQTWLAAIARWGPRHGLARAAAAIRFDARGRAFVADPRQAAAILALRYDPHWSAQFAAELAADNAAALSAGLGRTPSAGELYAAHVLGVPDALRLVRAAAARPQYPAAWLFPSAARANPRLFFPHGATQSVAEVLWRFS